MDTELTGHPACPTLAKRGDDCSASCIALQGVTWGETMCAAARSNEIYRTNTGTAIKIRPEPGPRPRLRGQEFVRVLADERRQFPRLPLKLGLALKRVDGRPEAKPAELQTVDISCSGIRFLSGRALEAGTPVDLEVTIAENPLGGPSMRMYTTAHIVRHAADDRGLHYMAAEFDDISFDRDPAPGNGSADGNIHASGNGNGKANK